jgi:hypothetical protein
MHKRYLKVMLSETEIRILPYGFMAYGRSSE